MVLTVLFLLVSGLALSAAGQELILEVPGGLAAASVTPALSSVLRRRRGRPRKFAGPSRAVTLTLPESVIEALTAADPDLSKAIVNLTKRRGPAAVSPPAELSVFGRKAVITVRPTPSLEQRAGVDLVPLSDGRALISFDQPKSIADVELMLTDAIEDPSLAPDDRKVFEGIAKILKEARRADDVSLLRRSIIVLESTVRAAKAVAKIPPRSAKEPGARRSARRL
jgi:hypothetical protein